MQYRKFIEQRFLVDEPRTGKLVPFILNSTQVKEYENLVRDYDIENKGLNAPIREIILKARRQGFSSLILALFAADDWMNDNPTETLVISYRDDATQTFRRRYRTYLTSCAAIQFGHAPEQINKNPGILEDMAKEIFSVDSTELELKHNKAHFYCGTASARTGGRGGVVQKLLYSEAAFYPDKKELRAREIIEGTMRQVDISSGWIFIESTANGMGNYYHQMWENSSAGTSRFKPRFFSWREFYSQEQFELIKSEITDKKLIPQEYPSCFIGGTRFSDKDGGIHKFSDFPEFAKGENDVHEIKTKLGYSAIATGKHLFKQPDESWKSLEDLNIGDKIKLLPPTFNQKYQKVEINLGLPILNYELKIDESLAEFIGLYMGDGSMGKSKKGSYYTLSLAFDKQDQDLVDKFQKKMISLFGVSNRRIMGDKKGGEELRFSSKYLSEFADSLELTRQNGSNSIKRNVHVPSYIMNSPKSVVAAFLRGLFEADGFCGYPSPRVAFFSQYEEFIKDVQLLLLGFGITSRLVIANKKAGDGHMYIGRQLELRKNEAELYMKEIGFLSNRKINRWKNRKVRVKHQSRVIPLVLEDEIVSKEYKGREMVYDKEVLPERYYSANGLFAHNSAEEAFISSGGKFFDLESFKLFVKQTPSVIGNWKYYRDYIPNHRYAIGCDVAEGVGQHFSTIIVIDFDANVQLESTTIKKPSVVAVYANNQIAPDLFAYEIAAAGRRYGTCIVAPERNNHGHATLVKLKEIYPNIYREERLKSANDHSTKLGWQTSMMSKPMMLNDLRTAVNEGLINIPDEDLLREMLTYPNTDLNEYQVREEDETDGHYDRVIGLAIALQMRGYAAPGSIQEEEKEEAYDLHSGFNQI